MDAFLSGIYPVKQMAAQGVSGIIAGMFERTTIARRLLSYYYKSVYAKNVIIARCVQFQVVVESTPHQAPKLAESPKGLCGRGDSFTRGILCRYVRAKLLRKIEPIVTVDSAAYAVNAGA
jgi:hypothetical protein